MSAAKHKVVWKKKAIPWKHRNQGQKSSGNRGLHVKLRRVRSVGETKLAPTLTFSLGDLLK